MQLHRRLLCFNRFGTCQLILTQFSRETENSESFSLTRLSAKGQTPSQCPPWRKGCSVSSASYQTPETPHGLNKQPSAGKGGYRSPHSSSSLATNLGGKAACPPASLPTPKPHHILFFSGKLSPFHPKQVMFPLASDNYETSLKEKLENAFYQKLSCSFSSFFFPLNSSLGKGKSIFRQKQRRKSD